MADDLLAIGPPPLTAMAADCAIALIDFMAAAVRGVDLIDVTPAVRDAWRAHLAACYPMLPLPYRLWFANSAGTLSALQTAWPVLPPQQREMYRQMWAMQLPEMLSFVNPILQAGAHAPILFETQPQEPVPNMGPNPPQAARPQAPIDVATQFENKAQSTRSMINFSHQMTMNTIDLIHAMNYSQRRY